MMAKSFRVIIISALVGFNAAAYAESFDGSYSLKALSTASADAPQPADPRYLICSLYSEDDKDPEYNPTEVFYFGPDEDRIRAEFESRMRFLDPTAKAHHDIRLIIGASLVTTAAMMTVLGLLHTDRELPRDYYREKKKYDELYKDLGYIPMVEVKEVYYPSIVIGSVLCSFGVYLFF